MNLEPYDKPIHELEVLTTDLAFRKLVDVMPSEVPKGQYACATHDLKPDFTELHTDYSHSKANLENTPSS